MECHDESETLDCQTATIKFIPYLEYSHPVEFVRKIVVNVNAEP